MTNEEIIQMARESHLPSCHSSHPVALKRFADVVLKNKKWTPLSDNDIAELCMVYGIGYPPVISPYTRKLIDAVEKKLMEKNK